MKPEDTIAGDVPPVEVRSLNKRYGNGTWANRDITFTVWKGELLGILGPNGAGKTTLVRQITTELLPTSGEVRVMGHSVVSDPLRAKSLMGTIPQEATLYEGLSVWHHLRAFGRLHGLSRRASRARAPVQEGLARPRACPGGPRAPARLSRRASRARAPVQEGLARPRACPGGPRAPARTS